MNHETCRSKLLELAYGELSRDEARAAEAHVTACAECRAELEKLQGTRRAMSRLPLESAPASGEDVLFAAAREAAARRRAVPPRRVIPSWAWGGAIGAVAAAAVVAVSYRLVELEPRDPGDIEALRGGGYESSEPVMTAPPPAPEAARARAPELRPQASAPRAEAPAVSAPAPKRAPSAPPPAPSVSPPPAAVAGSSPRGEEAAASARSAPHGGAAGAGESGAADTRATAAAAPQDDEAMRVAEDALGADRAESRAESPAEAPAADADSPAAAKGERVTRAPVARQPFPAAAPPSFGSPGVERRTFRDCPGERLRELERDAEGRVIRFAREGELGGRDVRIEARYDARGALRDVTVTPKDAAEADAAALGVPTRAAEATLDSPPRCDPAAR